MGRLIINNAMTVNGAYEAPVPQPGGWLLLDPDSQQASLEKWQAADAMVMGRKTYEGLATVWPQMAELPGFEAYAHQMNTMPKYVASRTLRPSARINERSPTGWRSLPRSPARGLVAAARDDREDDVGPIPLNQAATVGPALARQPATAGYSLQAMM